MMPNITCLNITTLSTWITTLVDETDHRDADWAGDRSTRATKLYMKLILLTTVAL